MVAQQNKNGAPIIGAPSGASARVAYYFEGGAGVVAPEGVTVCGAFIGVLTTGGPTGAAEGMAETAGRGSE
jgi:hypothetical protein